MTNKIYYSQVLEGTGRATRPHKVVGRERGREHGPGVLLLLVLKGGVPKVS